ncbi:MAG: serine/threonine-protein kinase [Polyangiaceae bacterium]
MKPTFVAGRTIGGSYTLVARIGTGGMSEVWSAKNERTGALLALKLLRSTESRTGDIPARFRHEAMVGAQLDHRNIARVYDFLEDADGTLVLVMALLRGKPLSEYLRERAYLSEQEAVSFALDVLAALAHAHDCGILHRDIKPENVFLTVDPDGVVTPKLLDFGIAKLPSGGVHTVDGTFLGTPQYMAPERVRDAGPIDARSDIFSVGVLLFEMLTGTSPFEKSSVQASLVAVLEEELDPDPRIPPLLWNVIRSLVAKAPGDRPASASDVAAAIRKVSVQTDFAVRWDPSVLAKPTLHEPAPIRGAETLAEIAPPIVEEKPYDEHVDAKKRDKRKVFVLATLGVGLFIILLGVTVKLIGGSADGEITAPSTTSKRADVVGAAPETHGFEAPPARSASMSQAASAKVSHGPRTIGKKPDF